MVYVVNYAHEIIIIILIKYLGCQNHGTLIGFWDLILLNRKKINELVAKCTHVIVFSSTLFPSVLSLPPSDMYYIL